MNRDIIVNPFAQEGLDPLDDALRPGRERQKALRAQLLMDMADVARTPAGWRLLRHILNICGYGAPLTCDAERVALYNFACSLVSLLHEATPAELANLIEDLHRKP